MRLRLIGDYPLLYVVETSEARDLKLKMIRKINQ